MSDFLWLHGLSCPSLSLWSWWCLLTISSSVAPFSSCPQSFPTLGSFPMSWLFVSGGQSIGASASALPMNIQGWFPLELTGLISLQFKELSRVFSSNTVWKHQFFGTQPFLWSNSHICNDYWKKKKPIALTTWTFVSKEMSLLFNILSGFVIASGNAHTHTCTHSRSSILLCFIWHHSPIL